MKMIVLLMLFLLAACDTGAADGYKFEENTKRIGDREIQFVLLPTPEKVVEMYNAQPSSPRPMGPNEELKGFGVISSTTCTIYIVDPKISYEPEWVGHEVTHCIYGNFHPSQDESK